MNIEKALDNLKAHNSWSGSGAFDEEISTVIDFAKSLIICPSKNPIAIEVTEDNDINADTEFLEAQKMLLSFVPKNKAGLLFKGLKSKLQYSIDRYVDHNSAKRMESIAKEHKKTEDKLSRRVEELEAICDAAGIKHKVTSEDVYTKRKDGFVND